MGLTFVLETRKLASHVNHLDDVSTVPRMFTMYDIKSFILFSPSASSSADCVPSAKMTISSAFITAVKAVNAVVPLTLPAFFSFTAVATDLSNLKNTFGYHNLRPRRFSFSDSNNASEADESLSDQ